MLAEAKASGLDQLPEFKKILKKRKIEEMTKPNGPLFNSIIPDHFDVSEKQIQTLYQRLPYRLTLQQILVTSKSLADSIFDALVKGADWDELVLKYSNDLYTANKQGVLSNYLTPGMAAPEYEEAAYSLWQVGQISQPVKTDFGYHIIRLMYREKLKVGSIEEEKARLEQIAQQAARTQFLRDYINSLFQKFHLTLNKNLYPALLKAFERKGIFGYVNPDKIDSEMMQQIFIKHDKDSLTLNDKGASFFLEKKDHSIKKQVALRLCGRFQAQNARLAFAALYEASQLGLIAQNLDKFIEGLLKTEILGRFQIIELNKKINFSANYRCFTEAE